jgi:hypothetical protein
VVFLKGKILERYANLSRSFPHPFQIIIHKILTFDVTGYGLDDGSVGVRVPVESRIFSSPRCLDQPWGPPSLLYNGYWGRGALSFGGKSVGARSWQLTTLCRVQENIHSSICLHGLLLNMLSTGTTVPFTLRFYAKNHHRHRVAVSENQFSQGHVLVLALNISTLGYSWSTLSQKWIRWS